MFKTLLNQMVTSSAVILFDERVRGLLASRNWSRSVSHLLELEFLKLLAAVDRTLAAVKFLVCSDADHTMVCKFQLVTGLPSRYVP